jgi:EAL domain-containing protein (putative c-di-GMP-specific phosphodiesterase class I)
MNPTNAPPRFQPPTDRTGCPGCRDGQDLDFAFSMAFQPIVDVERQAVYAYEALVRASATGSAHAVLSQVTEANRYAFDQQCRVKAIEVAAQAGLLSTPARLSINFLPNAVYSPAACIQLTLKTARATQMPLDRLIFEFTENERLVDPDHVANIVAAYRSYGFGTAIDDFGSGFAGLTLLARFQPDTVKLDLDLVHDIDSSMPRRVIVAAVIRMCAALGVKVVAEGIETRAELDTLRAMGVTLMQGYYFARPLFEALPTVDFGSDSRVRAA